MEDQCDNTTVFGSNKGTIEIRDFPARKTVQLRGDRPYIAGAKRSCGNLLVEPPKSPYAAINVTVSGVTCGRARTVLLGWLKRLPPYKGNKTKPFPASSGGWTFDAAPREVDGSRSRAARGVAALAFAVITTFFA
jgi:hypothetical protein